MSSAYLTGDNVSPANYYEYNVASIARKAEKYKKWSRCCTVGLVISTGVIPVFIGVFESWVLAKLVPCLLAAFSTTIASFVQLEKPQERWRLYRRGQRLLENEWLCYKNKAEDYKDTADPDSMLLHRIMAILYELHTNWEGLIPASTETASHAARGMSSIPKQ